MGSREKHIQISELPEAEKHRVQWLVSCGVQTHVDAKRAASAFFAALERVKANGGPKTSKKEQQ